MYLLQRVWLLGNRGPLEGDRSSVTGVTPNSVTEVTQGSMVYNLLHPRQLVIWRTGEHQPI